MPILNKDMQVCISLAGRPSNIGTRFHNFLYDELGLNFVYKAFTTDDLRGRRTRHPGARHPRMLGVDAVQGGDHPPGRQPRSRPPSRSSRSTRSSTRTACSRHPTRTTRQWPSCSPSTRSTRLSACCCAVPAGWRRPWSPRSAAPDSTTSRCSRATRRPVPRSPNATTTSWVAEEPEPDFDVIVNVTPLGMRGDSESVLAFGESRHRARLHRLRRRRLPVRDPAGRRCAGSRHAPSSRAPRSSRCRRPASSSATPESP